MLVAPVPEQVEVHDVVLPDERAHLAQSQVLVRGRGAQVPPVRAAELANALGVVLGFVGAVHVREVASHRGQALDVLHVLGFQEREVLHHLVVRDGVVVHRQQVPVRLLQRARLVLGVLLLVARRPLVGIMGRGHQRRHSQLVKLLAPLRALILVEHKHPVRTPLLAFLLLILAFYFSSLLRVCVRHKKTSWCRRQLVFVDGMNLPWPHFPRS